MIWNWFIAFVIGWINLPGSYGQVLLDNVCIDPRKDINAFTEKQQVMDKKISEITERQDRFEKLIYDKVSEISSAVKNLEEETSKLFDNYN